MAKMPVETLEKVARYLTDIIFEHKPVECSLDYGLLHNRHTTLVRSSHGSKNEVYASLHVTGLPIMDFTEVQHFMNDRYPFMEGVEMNPAAVEVLSHWGDVAHQHDVAGNISVKNTQMLKHLVLFATMGVKPAGSEMGAKIWNHANHIPGNIFHFNNVVDSNWNMTRLQSTLLLPRPESDYDHFSRNIPYRLMVIELITKLPCFDNNHT